MCPERTQEETLKSVCAQLKVFNKKIPPSTQDVCLSAVQGSIDGGENKG